jgi:hypothetical protein
VGGPLSLRHDPHKNPPIGIPAREQSPLPLRLRAIEWELPFVGPHAVAET